MWRNRATLCIAATCCKQRRTSTNESVCRGLEVRATSSSSYLADQFRLKSDTEEWLRGSNSPVDKIQMPCLLYALEACPLNKTQLRSLEFTLNRVLMKVFRTTSMDVIAECRYWFGLLEMETLIAKRKQRFMTKYVQSDNVLCQLFAHVESV